MRSSGARREHDAAHRRSHHGEPELLLDEGQLAAERVGAHAVQALLGGIAPAGGERGQAVGRRRFGRGRLPVGAEGVGAQIGDRGSPRDGHALGDRNSLHDARHQRADRRERRGLNVASVPGDAKRPADEGERRKTATAMPA